MSDLETGAAPELRGKVAVVTGGSGVLGAEFCRALARRGATVAILGRDINKAVPVEAELRSAGARAAAFSVDVLDREGLEEANEAIEAHFGPVDILVNGAGGNAWEATTSSEYATEVPLDSAGSFFELRAESIKHVLDLNYLGSLIPSQVFGRGMVQRGTGVIVNVSSMNAYRPLTKIPAYSAGKAAVTNFTQWLAVHLAGTGVRVNAIAPGFFASEQNRTLLFDEAGQPTERARKILRSTPMGRFGRPEELVGALLFLASDSASGFVNGITIPVDGAFSAYAGV
jgi:NAD(P)-dependent dehydrogenase (short-subunit alcohol dehydrogenase family)